MSAILGPIHHWLFRKIRLQNDLTNSIIEMAKGRGIEAGLYDIDEKFGVLPEGELGNIIDPTNIHGWLQGKIALVERRLAFVTKVITDENPENINLICECAKEFGRKNASGKMSSPSEGFEYYENTFVSGMPCDGVNMVVNEDSEELMWQETVDIHSQYWDESDVDVAKFYEIRNAMIEGVFEGSGLSFYALGNGVYKLVKE